MGQKKYRWQDYKKGLLDGIPIGAGYFAVSFTFGIMAKGVGMSAWQGFFISITNLTSAGQFAGVGVMAAGGTYFEMACTQLVINMRYFLMSCTLSQKLPKGMNPFHRYLISYGVTDEIFGVAACREGTVTPWYIYGLISVAAPGWGLGTVAGIISGGILPPMIMNALGIAIYGMFLAVIIPGARKDKAIMAVVIMTMLVSYLFSVIPVIKEISSGFKIIILTFLIAGIAAYLHPIVEENDVEELNDINEDVSSNKSTNINSNQEVSADAE